MLQNPITDHDPMKAQLIQRHGAAVAELLYDAAVRRRAVEDARAVELSNELTALHAEMSKLSQAAGERRAKSQARLAVAYTAYMEMCNEDARIDSADQAALAPLRARSYEIQEAMRSISLPRLSERELSDLAIYSSTNAEFLRANDKRLPPVAGPPLSELARINSGGGLHKPR